MLEQVVWGNTVEKWGISIIIIVGVLIVAKIVSVLNRKIIYAITRKTQNKTDDVVYDALESPVLFGIVLLGIWIAFQRLEFPENTVKAVNDAFRILVTLSITWFFSRLCSSLIDLYRFNTPDSTSSKTKEQSARMIPMIKRIVLSAVWIVGLIMALSNAGVNISALLGTLGIGGIAFALAAQDTVKSLFGAFTILTDKPFNIGDTVKIDNFEGTIIDVGIRSTKMRGYDNRIVIFPNYKIIDASITNISSEPTRRVVAKLGLTYHTTPEKMQDAIDILMKIPGKVENASPNDMTAFFSEFTDSALVITFTFFIEKTGDFRKVTSDVYMEILKDFNSAGLNFAFPTRTIYNM
ncbi:MAG: mechanosensitive ion channel family protein [Tannerellaceae bacterium]|jgi:MscS family membrane protein|nr:mechanosensitive ion channel family protein [Tannerellaceae bacterium]